MEPNRFSSTIGFIDLLFLTLLGFVFLFIMAFIMMNPPVVENIEPKADIIVMMEWDDRSPHDIDLWCKLPGDSSKIISFNSRKRGLVHLERDDRGVANDVVRVGDKLVINYRNHEVITWRGLPTGTYHISGHFYDRNGNIDENGIPTEDTIPGPVPVAIRLIQLNPNYQVLKEVQIILHEIGDEKTAFAFTITPQGDIVNIDTTEFLFISEQFERDAMGPMDVYQ